MSACLPRWASPALAAAGCAVLTSPLLAPPPGGGGDGDPDDVIHLTGVVRDFRATPDHPDFDVTPSNGYGHYCGNVATQLDAAGKPVFTGGGFRVSQQWRDASNNKICYALYDPGLGDTMGSHGAVDDGAITSAESFAHWFRDVPGVNLSTLHTITLTRDNQGLYSYETNDFHPIDGELFGNGNDQHNFNFTFEIAADFQYDASAGYMLEFKGDDDVWVFVDGRMVIDLGGIAGNRTMYVDFNRLGLTDGETYRMNVFHAERHQPQSHFRMWTNVPLDSVTPNSILILAD